MYVYQYQGGEEMTESEAIKELHGIRPRGGIIPQKRAEAIDVAISALEKQIPKKPIEKEMPYSEDVGFNSEWHCPCCNSYIGYFTEGMSEPEQMEYCNNCGQHIARDWSDEE